MMETTLSAKTRTAIGRTALWQTPVCKRVQDIIDRLAAYEETGLEPEEIISAAYTAKNRLCVA